MAALRSRLAEASAEHMSLPEFPLEAADSGPGSVSDAVSPEALDASDQRLEALQAEAHLLQDSLSGWPLSGSVQRRLPIRCSPSDIGCLREGS